MPPEGHQNAFWWPPKLDYHARGVAKRQTPPGGTGGHRKPPEGHLKVTLTPPGAPRGSQRPPGAIPTRISRERCHEKKVMAIPALFFRTGKLGVPLQKQASFGPGWAYRCSKNAGFEKSSSPDPRRRKIAIHSLRRALCLGSGLDFGRRRRTLEQVRHTQTGDQVFPV